MGFYAVRNKIHIAPDLSREKVSRERMARWQMPRLALVPVKSSGIYSVPGLPEKTGPEIGRGIMGTEPGAFQSTKEDRM